MKRTLSLAALAVVVWLPASAAGESLSEKDPSVSASGTPAVSVDFKNQRLSLQTHTASWATVLKELQHATGITVRAPAPPSGTVTVSFEQLPLERGLRRLLGVGANLLWIYDEAGRLSEVVMLGKKPTASAGGASGSLPSHDDSSSGSDSDTSHVVDGQPGGADPSTGATVIPIPVLLTSLRESNAQVRREAVTALGERAEDERDEVTKALGEALVHDVDKDVRWAAAETLGLTGSSAALSALRQALSDADGAVRERAVAAIADVGGPEADAILREALGSPDAAVRRAARDALRAIPE
jgi:hypothetical protein